MADLLSQTDQTQPGLRSRKKAKRHDEIIAAARTLFASQGIDATTVADIAAAAGISAPTVFNYFGSKDGVLIALISEGTMEAREEDRHLHLHDEAALDALILKMFVRISRRTLEIADKRIWRYAESAAIRHPETEFGSQYQSVTDAMIVVLVEFFGGLVLKTRSGEEPSAEYLGRLFYDIWIQCFLNLITEEEQTIAEHEERLKDRMLPLIHMLFDDASIKSPARKGTPA